MTDMITLTLTQDELEILADALEADLEGYTDSVKDARANGDRAGVQTFSEAADRIKAVQAKVQALVKE